MAEAIVLAPLHHGTVSESEHMSTQCRDTKTRRSAYAIQRRKQTRLLPSIQLPLMFESEDPQLLNGFVNLVHLFSAIDDNFVKVWRGTRRRSVCSLPWLTDMQRALDASAIALEDITETQQLDISVTREWLHMLTWQMGVSNGLIWLKGEGGMRLEYPVELARRVVGITTSANRLALDSHGIGMVSLECLHGGRARRM